MFFLFFTSQVKFSKTHTQNIIELQIFLKNINNEPYWVIILQYIRALIIALYIFNLHTFKCQLYLNNSV